MQYNSKLFFWCKMYEQILLKQAQPFCATVAYFLDVEHLQSGVSSSTYQLPNFKRPWFTQDRWECAVHNVKCPVAKIWQNVTPVLLLIKSDLVKATPGVSKIRAVTSTTGWVNTCSSTDAQIALNCALVLDDLWQTEPPSADLLLVTCLFLVNQLTHHSLSTQHYRNKDYRQRCVWHVMLEKRRRWACILIYPTEKHAPTHTYIFSRIAENILFMVDYENIFVFLQNQVRFKPDLV